MSRALSAYWVFASFALILMLVSCSFSHSMQQPWYFDLMGLLFKMYGPSHCCQIGYYQCF